MKKYICVRDCYYLETLWKVGNQLPEGEKPNKHFVALGEGEAIPEDPVALTPGDDKRSTKQIIKDLGNHGRNGMSRKEAFHLWMELVKDGEIEAPKTAKKSKKEKGGTPVKPISELTPDELDKMGSKQIGNTYGVVWAGKTKEKVIEEALEKE